MEEIKAHTYKWYEFGCKDASYLTTKASYARLSFSEKTMLKFHLAICKYCRRFTKQINQIDALIKLSTNSSNLKMAPERKLSVNQLITEKLTKS